MMDELFREGAKVGLTPAEVTTAVRLGRSLSEGNWCTAAEAKGGSLILAKDAFEAGRYLEHQCYDNQGREQGRAVVILRTWEDQDGGFFTGDYLTASDDYYAWYMENEVRDSVAYHLCQGPSQQCRKKLVRGDRRTLIHVDKWRLLTPQLMMETGYLKSQGKRLALQAIADAARDKGAPLVPPAGTGLDAALHAQLPAGGDGSGQEPRKEKEKDAKRKRSKSPPRGKGLAAKLAGQERMKLDEQGRGDSKKKKKKKKKKSRRDRSSSGSSSADETSESSGSVFREASTRGGDLWKVAQKKPGLLTEMSLKEMTRYLSGNSEKGLDKEAWSQQKVLAYLNQIVLTAHPVQKIGIRAHRELVTLATSLDYLLSSQNLQCLDVLMQRFKAVELSIQDGSWNLARHFELIPPSAAQLSREEERSLASKAEARRIKLAEAMTKGNKNK